MSCGGCCGRLPWALTCLGHLARDPGIARGTRLSPEIAMATTATLTWVLTGTPLFEE
jgi:hypothetical protein